MNNRQASNIGMGLVTLAVAIIIASLIITNCKSTHPENQGYSSNEQKIKLMGDALSDRIPLNVKTNSNDVQFYTELKVGQGENLFVLLSNGVTEKIQGQNIVATYYHVSKLLMVKSEMKGQKSFRYYNAPIKWSHG